jgi:hypothetical protein
VSSHGEADEGTANFFGAKSVGRPAGGAAHDFNTMLGVILGRVIGHHGVLDKGMCFIQKPFSRTELFAKVREALDTSPKDTGR